MFKKQAQLTDYINSIIGEDIIYGQNDCNLLCLKVIDISAGTDYFDRMKGQYTDIKSGFAKSKEIINYSNALDIIKDHADQVESVQNGDLLVSVRKEGRRNVYHVSVYFSGMVIAMVDSKYAALPYEQVDAQTIWRVR